MLSTQLSQLHILLVGQQLSNVYGAYKRYKFLVMAAARERTEPDQNILDGPWFQFHG
jgi:hypothetical protein